MKYIKSISFIILLIILPSWSSSLSKTTIPPSNKKAPTLSLLDINKPPFWKNLENNWVDSVLQQMSLDEKIGQLFMVAAYSNKSPQHKEKITSLIKKQKIGGLIFFQGTAKKEIELTNYYQSISKTPLLIAGDWEWGLAMRLKNTIRFPRQMMLGAIQDQSLIYKMGVEIAREIRLIGGHINFAPVVDINNNPKNPVIGSRSFGEDREIVFERSYQYMKGLQDNNVLAVAKHFPGHGDTDVDSHKALPIIYHSRARLDSIELYPFRRLFSYGIGGVMVAHLFVPALDSTPHTATTLSHKVSTDLLKKELGFKGLAFTDALNMKGVSNYFSPGEADLKALLAGNDILLFPKDVPTAIRKIKEAIKNGKLSIEDLEKHVRKILATKYWSGLNKKQVIDTKDIQKKLHTKEALLLNQQLIENALTVVRNQDNTLPLKNLKNKKIAAVSVGNFQANEFQKTLQLYDNVSAFFIKKYSTTEEWNTLLKKLKAYDLVIFSFNKTNRSPKKNYGISLQSVKRISKYAETHSVIVDVFANPYILKKFPSLDVFKAVVVSYNDWKLTQKLSAQLIFGGIAAKGKLPISINNKYPLKTGSTYPATRLKYSTALDAKINDSLLYKIDSIAINSIREGAFPGCQILAARNGKIFYHKSFGYFTYERKQKVDNNNIYDLASLTKVLSTTLTLMKLDDEKLFDYEKTLGDYLSYLKGTNKENLKIKDVLTHQAQLKPWIPFYLHTIKPDSLKDKIYKTAPQGKWSIKIANNLYMDSSYKDTIIQEIIRSPLRRKTGYKYSDLGYYLLQKIIEKNRKEKLNQVVQDEYYKDLGANYTGYLPLHRFPLKEIVPTELDNYYRNQLIQGYVHDMGAAMLGGVGGHAGLFSNSNDIAKILQMLLNNGNYGGKHYIDSATIVRYTTCVYCPDNRRGIGFDKAEMNPNKLGPTSKSASANSFGHTGFTGTMFWVDPDSQLIYIFLSNRINPTATNKKLIKLSTRTKIQEVLYQSLL